jgi:DNA-binding ferritin-like protein
MRDGRYNVNVKPRRSEAMGKAKVNRAQVISLLVQIEQRKTNIATERDKLRRLVNDVNDILESTGEGIEDIENGLRDLQNGLDRISEFV